MLWLVGLTALLCRRLPPDSPRQWDGFTGESSAAPDRGGFRSSARLAAAGRAISRNGPGSSTTLTLDASGRLAEQIKAGAPFDVFMSANVKFVRDLADAGLD